MLRINHRRFNTAYAVDHGANYLQSTATQIFSQTRGPNNGVNMWDFQHVDPGRNRPQFMRYTRWPGVNGNGQTGWTFNPFNVLTVPFSTLAAGVVSLKFRMRVMQPLGNGPHSAGQKWFIWGGPGIPDRQNRMIFALQNGLYAGGTLNDHTSIVMGAGVSGNRCAVLIPNRQWVDVQLVWRHGLAGQNPYMRVYVDNNNEAAPNAEHTTFTADGMGGNWPAPSAWNTGFWGNVDSNDSTTDTTAVFDFQGAILQQGFDPAWHKVEQPVTNIGEGRWGISRIVEPTPNAFTTAAQQQGLGRCVAHYPALATVGYSLPFALVHFPDGITGTPDVNTRLLPNLPINTTTIGDLPVPQRNALRNNLEEWLIGYGYTGWEDVPITKATFSAAGFSLASTLADVVRAVYSHLGHTSYRPRYPEFESHNTEYTDDFSVGIANWTGFMGGIPTHDAVDFEMDCNTEAGDSGVAYSANNPGSIEQEAQITFFNNGRATQDVFGVAVRIDRTASDAYFIQPSRQNSTHWIVRYNAAVRTTVATLGTLTLAADIFMTERGAATGTVGSNVVLDVWMSNHGTTKPADPGWFGTDATPDFTTTDTSVDRLDAATHIECGVGWVGSGADWDTRCDFFKERAITDRAGASTAGRLVSGCLINGLLMGSLA